MRKIAADSYQHEFHTLSDHEVFFDRLQSYPFNHMEIDVYPEFWSFFFADVPEKGIRITHLGQNVDISGKVGILVPPHAVIRWQVRAPKLHWFAYSNGHAYPRSFPEQMTIFQLDELPQEVSPQWLMGLVQNHSRPLKIHASAPNSYARKLKMILDQEYRENVPLADYAKRLGLSKEWLIRYFKTSYDITPIAYRNKKRVMQSLFALHTEDQKIVSLSNQVGFNDLKQFNTLFKKVIRATPSEFRA